jgi:cytochrome P450
MTELKVIAATLLQRFRFSVPAGSTPPKPVFHVSLRPEQPLRLSLTPS